jgi:hypothetical protein
MADGLMISEDNQDYFCEGCLFGKQHRLPFPIGRTRGTHVGHIVHSDVCGPISVPAVGGSTYFLTLKDDFSGYCIIHFLKRKSEVMSLSRILSSAFKLNLATQWVHCEATTEENMLERRLKNGY